MIEDAFKTAEGELGNLGFSVAEFKERVRRATASKPGLSAERLVLRDIFLALGVELRSERGIAVFWREYRTYLTQVARKYARDSATVEDIVGACVERISERIRTYSGTGSLHGWLAFYVRGMAIDHVRKFPGAVAFEPEREESVGEHGAHTAESSECEELIREVVPKAIERLPDDLKLVIQCVYFEKIKKGEIARTLGVHAAGVSRRLKQAMDRLERELRAVVQGRSGDAFQALVECLGEV